MKQITFGIVLFAALLTLFTHPVSAERVSHFKKVMIVIFENTDYNDTMHQSFFSQLASQGALLTNLYAETHPSQPNYIALISGSVQGSNSDELIDIDARHIGDLLEAKGKQWKVYAEKYPGNCFLGDRSKTYVRKHVPFVSFKNVQNNSERCKRIVSEAELAKDIQNGTLPDYSLYIPDLNNDGHDTGIEFADRWFSKTFGPLLSNRAFMKDLLLISTFDESGIFGGNRIYTSLYGDGVSPASTSNAGYSHYSILRTIEDELGLGTLGLEDSTAEPITGVWK